MHVYVHLLCMCMLDTMCVFVYMYVDYNMSPDGKHLLVETMKRPFSRLVLMNR